MFKGSSYSRSLSFIAQVLIDEFWMFSRAFVISSLVSSQVNRFVEIKWEAEFEKITHDFVRVIVEQLAPEGDIEFAAWERDATSMEIWAT